MRKESIFFQELRGSTRVFEGRGREVGGERKTRWCWKSRVKVAARIGEKVGDPQISPTSDLGHLGQSAGTARRACYQSGTTVGIACSIQTTGTTGTSGTTGITPGTNERTKTVCLINYQLSLEAACVGSAFPFFFLFFCFLSASALRIQYQKVIGGGGREEFGGM